MHKRIRGFTIIELLVVVAVIGILATIVLIGFNRYQADTRDSARSSQATIIAEALEKYYDKNGEYPGCGTMTGSASTVTSALTGLDPKVLVTPQAVSGDTNSIDFCTDITTSTPTDSFAYVGDGSSACSTGSACLQFKLEYKQESTGTIKSISSRRTTNILSSGNIADLSASASGFAQVNLTWTAISGAAAYNIQYATNSSMTSPTAFTPAAITNSASVSGLTIGTQYYFQVQPVTTTGVAGNWSNTATATTYTLGTPSVTAVTDAGSPASQIDVTWANVTNAASYTVVYNSTGTVDVNGTLTLPTTITNVTSPYMLSGLAAGSTRYFQVRSNASGYSSGYSSVTNATTTVPVPTVTATATSNSTFTGSWSNVSVATSYNVQYSTNNSSWISAGSTTATSMGFGPTTEGQIYYVQVQAVVGSVKGNWSNSASVTLGVDTPSAPGITAVSPGAVRNSGAADWFPGTGFTSGAGNYYYAYGQITAQYCPSGTYPVYTFGAHYSVKPSGAAQDYSQGPTTDTTWYAIRVNSPYTITFSANNYCQGANSSSGYSQTNSATVGH